MSRVRTTALMTNNLVRILYAKRVQNERLLFAFNPKWTIGTNYTS